MCFAKYSNFISCSNLNCFYFLKNLALFWQSPNFFTKKPATNNFIAAAKTFNFTTSETKTESSAPEPKTRPAPHLSFPPDSSCLLLKLWPAGLSF